MKRHTMILADPDESYLEAVTAYINTAMTGLSVEIRAVSSGEALRDHFERRTASLTVISEHFFPDLDAMARQETLRGGTVVILTEGIRKSPCEGIPAVSKYRTVPDMMQRILRIYSGHSLSDEGTGIKEDMMVIGIYSPVGRCLKSSLALALGQILAADRPTLLLDLESQAAYPAWFDRAYIRDLSDLAAAVMENKPHFTARLNACTEKIGALDYVPPFTIGLDAPDVPQEVWTKIITGICENSAYEALVIDIGGAVCGLRPILAMCDKILLPVPEDTASQAKADDYLKTMDLWDPDLKEKFMGVDLSGLGTCGLGTEAPSELPDGPLGGLARRIAEDIVDEMRAAVRQGQKDR